MVRRNAIPSTPHPHSPSPPEHNKRVFHQQMLETGSSLLFDGEYSSGYPSAAPGYAPAYYPQAGQPSNPYAGAVAPYASHVYMPQQTGASKPGGYGYDAAGGSGYY